MVDPTRDVGAFRARPSFQRCGHCRRLPGAERSDWKGCSHCGVLVCVKTTVCAILLAQHEAQCPFRPTRCTHCEHHYPLNQLPEHEVWCRAHVARCELCTVAHERRMLQTCHECPATLCSYCHRTHRCRAAA
jgi:hypothetical protein